MNLVLTIVLGTIVATWISLYTDWFTPLVTLLSLGGILSWVAVLLKLIPEPRTAALREWIFDHCINRAWLAGALVVGFVAWLGLSFSLGSIDLNLAEANKSAAVSFFESNSRPHEPVWMPKGDRQRFVFWTRPFGERAVLLKVSGYPVTRISVKPWCQATVRVPDSLFEGPIMLIHPGPRIMNLPAPLPLKVTFNDKSHTTAIWQTPIWIGCDGEVDVPDELIKRWAAKGDNPQRITLFWLHPQPLEKDLVLAAERPTAGTTIDLEWHSNGVLKTKSLKVMNKVDGLPQDEEFDE